MEESKRLLKQNGQSAENDLKVHWLIHTKSGTGWLVPKPPHISVSIETVKSLWTFL